MRRSVFIVFVMTSFLTSCIPPTDAPHYECRDDYDHWTVKPTECRWYYSIDNNYELDQAASISEKTEFEIRTTAQYYANKYELSLESANKFAKQLFEIKYLKDRSVNDIADFAQRLYGINSYELIDAISDAQVGDNSKLDALIKESSQNFNTSNRNMKLMIKDIHQKALESNGINLDF